MNTFNRQISTATALNANSNSIAVPLRNIFMYAISANISGTPTGTLKLQGSADPETNATQTNKTTNEPPTALPTNWSDISGSSQAVTASGVTLWNIQYVAYNYVRVVYTDTSGGASTATMNIVFNGKGS